VLDRQLDLALLKITRQAVYR